MLNQTQASASSFTEAMTGIYDSAAQWNKEGMAEPTIKMYPGMFILTKSMKSNLVKTKQ